MLFLFFPSFVIYVQGLFRWIGVFVNATTKSIYMTIQARFDPVSHRIKDEIDTFSSSVFRCWDEVAIASDQHNLGNLFLVSK